MSAIGSQDRELKRPSLDLIEVAKLFHAGGKLSEGQGRVMLHALASTLHGQRHPVLDPLHDALNTLLDPFRRLRLRRPDRCKRLGDQPRRQSRRSDGCPNSGRNPVRCCATAVGAAGFSIRIRGDQ
jgi:hypothetical protein